MKPLVLYHANCWDGFCAAWVARKALGDIEAVPVYYGNHPPDVIGREVYVLDFCYSEAEMEGMAALAKSLVVLDHHQTAAQTIQNLEDLFSAKGQSQNAAFYGINKSGARMAWEYFAYGRWINLPAPWLVDYTEDRDLWRHALPDSQEVNAALRSYPLDFFLWDKLEAEILVLERLRLEGEAIRRAERQIIQTHVRNARLHSIAGHQVKVVNATVLFSEIAGELAKGMPFGACYFDRNDGKRQWSLRSTAEGLNVAEIAKQYGGGGHAQAAGFEEGI